MSPGWRVHTNLTGFRKPMSKPPSLAAHTASVLRKWACVPEVGWRNWLCASCVCHESCLPTVSRSQPDGKLANISEGASLRTGCGTEASMTRLLLPLLLPLLLLRGQQREFRGSPPAGQTYITASEPKLRCSDSVDPQTPFGPSWNLFPSAVVTERTFQPLQDQIWAPLAGGSLINLKNACARSCAVTFSPKYTHPRISLL